MTRSPASLRADPTPPTAWLDGPSAREADAAIAKLHGQVMQHVRVPYLGPLWRALLWADPPATALWSALEPVMASRAFERAADDLRAISLIEGAAEMPAHQAFKADLVRAEIDWDLREKIGSFNAAVQYALAKHLLAATWLGLWLDGKHSPLSGSSDRIEVGLAPGAVPVPPVTANETSPTLAALLESIRDGHRHPFADDYFRSLGRLPEYLNAAWNFMRPIVRDDPYEERAELLRAAAYRRAHALPAQTPPQFLDDTRDRLRIIARYYAHHYLPDLLMDASMVKAITDGPERARHNPFAMA